MPLALFVTISPMRNSRSETFKLQFVLADEGRIDQRYPSQSGQSLLLGTDSQSVFGRIISFIDRSLQRLKAELVQFIRNRGCP